MAEPRSWARALTSWQEPHRDDAAGGGVLDAGWQAYLFPQSERVAAVGRMCAAVLTTGWWAVGLHGRPAVGDGVSVALIAAVLVGSCLAFALAVFACPRLFERLALVGVTADVLLLAVWLWAMGTHVGPFLGLILVGAASSPTRVPLWGGVLGTAAYALLSLHFGGAAAVPLSGYTVIVGLGMATFSSGVHRDRLQSMRDPLTGVFSRRWGFYRVQTMIGRASYPFCMAVVDLDQFKDINDRYGHIGGDQVLAALAGLMQVNLRQGDAVARLGGDEFLLVLPGADIAGARAVADRVRALLAEARVLAGADGRPVQATASIGLVEAAPGMTLHDLLERADACLYEAKRRHNTVVSDAV